MIWAAWRQQRLIILVWVSAVAALVGYMLVVAFAYQNDTHLLATHHCGTAAKFVSHFCNVRRTSQANDRSQIAHIVGALYVLPLLGGALLGAPLVASEIDRKTNRLAWTQGVSRTRWLVWKWTVAATAVALPMAGLVVAVVWWRVAVGRADVMMPANFDFTGVVIIGYTLFSFALGVALGALLRHTLLAVLGTAVGFGLFRWWVEVGLRPHFAAPLTVRSTVFPTVPGWFLSEGLVSLRGASATRVNELYRHCSYLVYRRGGITAPTQPMRFKACLVAHHIEYAVVYQPFSRYWAFQGIETAIFGVAALLLLGATVWIVRWWRA
jgi:hypothetical protein